MGRIGKIFLLIVALIMVGCQAPSFNGLGGVNTDRINRTLPKVRNFKAHPGRNQVALTWDAIPEMGGYYIQRWDPESKSWVELATITNPFKTIYVDDDLKPNNYYKYQILAFTRDKVPGPWVQTGTKTLPPPAPVIPVFAQPVGNGVIKIIWRPHPNERVHEYLIQRYNDHEARWEDMETKKPRYNVEFIDTGLEDGKIYKYRIIGITFDGLYTFPSKTIRVSTYPRPPVVTDAVATIDRGKMIIVKWSPIADVAYYKIYISDTPSGPFEYHAKTDKTYFVDKINKDGYKRYYKITAVSKFGTESLLSKTPVVMGETLPKPAKPIVSTNKFNNIVQFIMTSPDNRAVKYLIVRKTKIGFFKEATRKFVVSTNKFQDQIAPNTTYIYEIYAIDASGVASEPTVVKVEN
ncbi:MAG: hypothetical protein C6I01_04255 [Epsilonproteobacteria bacterium]|jgi:fibronectin type 3 domain-containing protein|nr:hypothetical protein [Campylobacterota bacterium]NPA89611.1 fibronectin type III domain-containing protein [Campylobacterota bacterium]